jgi:hypothetical protein
MAGAAMLSHWRLREQMLDGATRGGGRATRSVVVAMEDDNNGWDLPPLPARRRWMRRCRCPLRPTTETTKTKVRDVATRRNERGGGDDKGQASGNDSPSRRDAAELEALWRCKRSGDMSLSGKLGGLRSRGGGQKTSATFFTSATFLDSF